MDSKKFSELIAEKIQLEQLSASLKRDGLRVGGNELIARVMNEIGEGIAKIGGRFADAYKTSDDRKKEETEFRTALEEINSEYEAMADKIMQSIERKQTMKNKAMMVMADRKTVIKNLEKNVGKHSKDKGLTLEERIAAEKEKVAEQEKAYQKASQPQEPYNKIVEDCDNSIEDLNTRLENLKKERDAKIAQLSQNRSLVKQSPISRFLGMFGVGAAKRVEAIRNSINERTAQTIAAKRELREEIADTQKHIDEVDEAIAGRVDERIDDSIARVKEEVVARFNVGKDFAEKVGQYISSTMSIVSSSAKGQMQHLVGKALEGLTEFSAGEGKTKEELAKAKEDRSKIFGDKKDKQTPDLGEI